MSITYLSKTLTELENSDWGKPNFDSHLVVEIHRLRKIPLSDFTVENLRITIGQELSLDYVIPLALKALSINVYAEGDYYPGDLLQSVLRINHNYWLQNLEFYKEVERLIKNKKLSRYRIDSAYFKKFKLTYQPKN
jgi:CDI immunity proteins